MDSNYTSNIVKNFTPGYSWRMEVTLRIEHGISIFGRIDDPLLKLVDRYMEDINL